MQTSYKRCDCGSTITQFKLIKSFTHGAARRADLLPVQMKAGDMLAYSSALLHGTGANTSLCATVSVAFQCSLGWLRQEENQCLAHPPAMARALPEKLRRLLGYDFGGPSLGFVGRDDPHRVFEVPPHGPARRSTPEIDAAQRKLMRQPFTISRAGVQ